MRPVLSASEKTSARGKDLRLLRGVEALPVIQGPACSFIEAQQNFIDSLEDNPAFIKGKQGVDLSPGKVTAFAFLLQSGKDYLQEKRIRIVRVLLSRGGALAEEGAA